MANTWGTADVTIAISPVSLSNWGASPTFTARASAVIDFSALSGGPFSDVLVWGQTQTGAGTVGDLFAVYIYAYGTTGGTNYTDGVTGSDASITTPGVLGLARIGTIPIQTAATSTKGGPWSFRAAFGGTLPSKGGIVIVNRTNLALGGAAANHLFMFQATP